MTGGVMCENENTKIMIEDKQNGTEQV